MGLVGVVSAHCETHRRAAHKTWSLASLLSQASDAVLRGGFVAVHCTNGAQYNHFLVPGIWAICIFAVCYKHVMMNICGVTRVTLCLFVECRIQSHQSCHADYQVWCSLNPLTSHHQRLSCLLLSYHTSTWVA